MKPLLLERPGIRPIAILLTLLLVTLPGWLHSGFLSLPALIGPAFFAIDWLMLALLPVLKISWGPIMPPLTAISIVRALITSGFALVLRDTADHALSTVITQTALSTLAFYGLYIESTRITVTREVMTHPAISRDGGVTLLHISDLHFERRGRREEKLLRLIRNLAPDAIVVSGDFINLSYSQDRETWRELNAYLKEWDAPAGITLVAGTPLVESAESVAAFIEGLGFTWLRDESQDLPGFNGQVTLTGITCTHDMARDSAKAAALCRLLAPERCNLLLYHSPDIAATVAEHPVDLMLCGHTHGGQIRLPLIGAVVTSSALGKRYVMGAYPMGRGRLYVSRGVGMEGGSAPRARLICPPEIILWKIAR